MPAVDFRHAALIRYWMASARDLRRQLETDLTRIAALQAQGADLKATGRTHSGRSVGRPRREVDLQAVARMHATGRSWREIAVALKVPTRTLHRAWQNLGPKAA